MEYDLNAVPFNYNKVLIYNPNIKHGRRKSEKRSQYYRETINLRYCKLVLISKTKTCFWERRSNTFSSDILMGAYIQLTRTIVVKIDVYYLFVYFALENNSHTKRIFFLNFGNPEYFYHFFPIFLSFWIFMRNSKWTFFAQREIWSAALTQFWFQVMQKSCRCNFMYGELTDKETITKIDECLETQMTDQFELLLYKKNSKFAKTCFLQFKYIFKSRINIILILHRRS